MVYTRDGFTWTPCGGLRNGLPTVGVVEPSEYFAPASEENEKYDVIVIGAGYAGLVAARDLATQGREKHKLRAQP